jgi:hypothetical protein
VQSGSGTVFPNPELDLGAVQALRPNPEPHQGPVWISCGPSQISTLDHTAPQMANHHPFHQPSCQANHWHALDDSDCINLHQNKQTDAFLQYSTTGGPWTVEHHLSQTYASVHDGPKGNANSQGIASSSSCNSVNRPIWDGCLG